MRARIFVLAVALFGAAVNAFAAAPSDFRDCPQFFAGGHSPVVNADKATKTRALCFNSFAVLHSGTTKTPVFVAEKLNRAQVLDARGEQRHDKFFADARLPSAERAELEDYRGSGFDRGHMAPAADMPNQEAMAQSFSLANIVPQAPENNQKTWAKIEKDTRKYAMRASGDVFVISGPVFVHAMSPTVVGKGVRVPSHLFKLVYDASSGRAWAHWLENTDEARAGRPISYAELVRRTGIEFLPSIPVKDFL
jgi:endonuclease G, mitochondrial